MKKVLLGFGALAIAVALAPMFAAFEAHVVNVTATIENALSVPVDPITFGTVFPQEELEKNLSVALSGSFMTENRVDDVEYIIRQKPKCAYSWQDAAGVWNIDEPSTTTGHVIPTVNDLQTSEDESNGGTAYTIDCGPAPVVESLPEGVDSDNWGVLPSLCQYISKHGDDVAYDRDGLDEDGNDGTLNSFHQPFTVSNGVVNWTEVDGYLSKLAQDTNDTWVIDLAVPCFGGYCAQDWLSFVNDINPDITTLEQANAYTQPISNEHKVFGCDLWVEVTEVSPAAD